MGQIVPSGSRYPTSLRLRQLVCKQDQAATFSVIVFMTIPSSYLAPW